MPIKTIELELLGQALDAESWDWLETHHPNLADAIQAEMKRGADPGAIYRFVMARTDRRELALRLEQAARWLGVQ